jgi:bifunctional non-homologous end joining protein LigD
MSSHTLATYNRKRDFSKTAEPQGKRRKRDQHRFVIQKHDASRLHFDFRLEHDGVLKSWAVPKGPSLDPADKRLAVQVEDHPIDYGRFEGTIPDGEYGGGTVQLWDRGHWRPVETDDPGRALRQGKIAFELDGERLHGRWALVQMRGPRNKSSKNWLLIKEKDRYVKTGRAADLAAIDASVESGRSLAEIAAGDSPEWRNGKARQPKGKAKSVGRSKAAVKKAGSRKAAAMPGFIAPQLAKLWDYPPEEDGWAHEIKFDGYRIQLHIQDGKVTAFSRNGLDWTGKFPEIVAAAAKLPDGLVDGEVCALAEGDRPDFSALQAALQAGETGGLVFFAFDLLWAAGKDLRDQPFEARKKSLQTFLPPQAKQRRIRFVPHFISPGEALRLSSCRMGLEGIVSKQLDAHYQSGRSDLWVKTKCRGRQEFVIGGYSRGTAGKGIGALLVGVYDGKQLRYRGRVGTGFNSKTAAALGKALHKLKAMRTPFAGTQPDKTSDVIWVKPKLVGEVEYGGWTGDGLLRHAAFKGLREDKPATSVRGEGKAVAKAKIADAQSKVTLSNPDKKLWPREGITKADLAAYYARMAEPLLRFAGHRPLSIIRAPDGIAGETFFQRHHNRGTSALIGKVKIRGEKQPYLVVDDAEALRAMAQWGVVELHPWGATTKDITRPDQLIFDLDPDAAVPFGALKTAAFALRDRLEDFGLTSFPKLTGGKGVHVVVPLKPRADWKQAKAFTHALALAFEQADPEHFIAEARKAKRRGKIFVDYLRNDRSATAVACWSPRARPGAPLAVPVTWEFLKKQKRLPLFTLRKLGVALKHIGDWDDFEASRTVLTKTMLQRVGA